MSTTGAADDGMAAAASATLGHAPNTSALSLLPKFKETIERMKEADPRRRIPPHYEQFISHQRHQLLHPAPSNQHLDRFLGVACRYLFKALRSYPCSLPLHSLPAPSGTCFIQSYQHKQFLHAPSNEHLDRFIAVACCYLSKAMRSHPCNLPYSPAPRNTSFTPRFTTPQIICASPFISYFSSFCKLSLARLFTVRLCIASPSPSPFSSVTRLFHTANTSVLAGNVNARFLQKRFFLRGSKGIAGCFLSTKIAHACIFKRSLATGGGGFGRKTAEELLVWEKTLEKREHEMSARMMILDNARLSVATSWKNIGNVHGRRAPPGLLGALKAIGQERLPLYVWNGMQYGSLLALSSAIMYLTFQPGELDQLPGNVYATLGREASSMGDDLRKRLGYPAMGKVKEPAAGSPLVGGGYTGPSSITIIFGGSYPFYSGRILYGKSPWGSLKSESEDGEVSAKGQD